MEHICNICDKKYKSYQSLWNHNKKFHTANLENIQDIDESKLIYICKYCNKKFDKKQKKWYHQQKCKDTSNNITTTIPKEGTITNINNNINNNKLINSNNNINNGTINKTIIINNYGNDNLEYISEKFKDKLFKYLLDDEEHNLPIPKLLENTF